MQRKPVGKERRLYSQGNFPEQHCEEPILYPNLKPVSMHGSLLINSDSQCVPDVPGNEEWLTKVNMEAFILKMASAGIVVFYICL